MLKSESRSLNFNAKSKWVLLRKMVKESEN